MIKTLILTCTAKNLIEKRNKNTICSMLRENLTPAYRIFYICKKIYIAQNISIERISARTIF